MNCRSGESREQGIAVQAIYWFQGIQFSSVLEPEKRLNGAFLFAGMAPSHKVINLFL